MFSPCGQIVEYLRTCYSTHFRLWIGGVETIVPARWFFAPKGAKEFAYPNAFVSNVWAKPGEESAPGPGEIDRKRVWDPGGAAGYQGQCFLGDPEWFATGQLPAGVLNPPIPFFPGCCRKGVKCFLCSGGIGPNPMTVRASGGTGDFAVFNGTFNLPEVNDCSWAVQFAPGLFWQVAFGPQSFIVSCVNSGPLHTESNWDMANDWSCFGPARPVFGPFDTIGVGTPPTITML